MELPNLRFRMPRRAVGIDPSLTATGVAILQGFSIGSTLDASTLSPKLSGMARLAWFREQFIHLLRSNWPSLVAIEGYSFGSRNGREQAGELGGVLRLTLFDLRIPTVVVPPTSLKKFVAGKGNVEKGVIQKDLFKRWGIDLNDNNQADAAGLALMAKAILEPEGLTAFQQEAIEKVEVLPRAPAPAVRQRVRPETLQPVAKNC